MNIQTKSVLIKLLVSVVATIVLFAIEAMTNTLLVNVLCKAANVVLYIWTIWLSIKLTYLAGIHIWHASLAKIKTAISKKPAIKQNENSIKPVELKVQPKPNQLMYEDDFEDNYHYGLR